LAKTYRAFGAASWPSTTRARLGFCGRVISPTVTRTFAHWLRPFSIELMLVATVVVRMRVVGW